MAKVAQSSPVMILTATTQKLLLASLSRMSLDLHGVLRQTWITLLYPVNERTTFAGLHDDLHDGYSSHWLINSRERNMVRSPTVGA